MCPALESAITAAHAGGATVNDWRVLGAVIVRTARWSRTWDRLSRSELAEATGMTPRNVARSVAHLREMGAIRWSPGGTDADGRTFLSTVHLGPDPVSAPTPHPVSLLGTDPVSAATPITRESLRDSPRRAAAAGDGGAAALARNRALTEMTEDEFAGEVESDRRLSDDQRAAALAEFRRCRGSAAVDRDGVGALTLLPGGQAT